MSEEFRRFASFPELDLAPNRGRYVISVIGIDNYAQWPKLHNAVSDAQGIQKLFTEKFGFRNPISPLLNEEATEDAILELVQDLLPQELKPEDNLILFFAGHGHTRVSMVGDKLVETGYIVPVDARTDHWSDYIKLSSLLEDIGQLPARHILLILDACHSGFALGSSMELHRSAVRYEQDLIKRRSRKVISSARRDQPAVDSGPVPGHSLFTGTIVDGFNWGKVDLDGNGLITSFELGLFLQQQVGQASDAKQTPDFGSFYLDDRGEMVISLGDNNFDAVKARAFTALRYRDLKTFAQLVEQLSVLRPQSPEVLYLQFRLHFDRYQIEEAAEKIDKLRFMNIAPGTIPLSQQDLTDLSVQLPFWKPILSIQPDSVPVELSLLNGSNTDELTEVVPIRSTGSDLYRIPNRSIARYKVTNLSPTPAHLYMIAVQFDGRLRIGPLLESANDAFNGLAPGAEAYGHPFAVSPIAGIYETRIFYSPERLDPMLMPPTTASRAVMFLHQSVDHVRMKQVLHEITIPTPVQPAHA